MIQYHPNNPLRPVDWRWERARILREQKLKFSKYDDKWVKLAYKFQLALMGCKDDIDRFELLEKNPTIYFAYVLKGQAQPEAKLYIKSEIEARLLSRQSYDEIAKKCSCTPETIDAFENLFFNINDRLDNPTYIVHQVMGPAIHRGLYQREYDLLWKLYGYFCGPLVIDALTTTFTNPVRPGNSDQVDSMFVDDTRSTMRRKAALAARSISVTDMTQLAILEMYTKFLEIEKDTPGASSKDMIEDNISEMMKTLGKSGWAVGQEAEKSTNRVVQHYDKLEAEPRSDELLIISLGKETAEHRDLENLKFPEAPTNVQKTK